MSILRETESWMRHRVETQLNRTYPELDSTISRRNWDQRVNELMHAKRWYITISVTILLFVVIAILFNWAKLGIAIDPKDTKPVDFGKFIDDRASNLATITSMSLAVIAFLLSNIAIKEPYAIKLLFQRTKLSFVVIFALTSLGIFVCVSAYRFITKPDYSYENVVLASAIMFGLVLILIGYLFIEIIDYIDPAKIDGFINRQLADDAIVIVREGMLVTKSQQAYEYVMRQAQVPPFNLSTYFDPQTLGRAMRLMHTNESHPAEPKKSYVIDLNLTALRTYLHERKDQPLTYLTLRLGLLTDVANNYISVPGQENSAAEQAILGKLLIKSAVYPDVALPSEIRKHHDEKLTLLAEDGKHKELERILNGIRSLYDLQLLYQLPVRYDVTSEIPGRLNEAMRLAINHQHYRCFLLLVTFCLQTSVRASKSYSVVTYKSLLFIYPDLYLRVLPFQTDESYADFFPLSLEATAYYEQLLYQLTEQKRLEPDHLEVINEMGSQTYASLAYLGYQMINKADIKHLRSLAELLSRDLLDNIPYTVQADFYQLANSSGTTAEALEKAQKRFNDAYAFRRYRRHVMLGLKAWVIHLYRLHSLSDDSLIAMNQLFALDYETSREALEDIMQIRTARLPFYFAWLGWFLPSTGNGEQDQAENPLEWLTFGFFVSQIIRNQVQIFLPEKLLPKDRAQLTILVQQFEMDKTELMTNFERWQPILRVADVDELVQKADAIIGLFRSLTEKQELAAMRSVAEAELDTAIIDQFKKDALKNWLAQAHLWQLFRSKGAIIPATGAEGVKFVGRTGYEEQLKPFFLEDNGQGKANILMPLVGDAARQTDADFFNIILQQCPPFREGATLDLIVESLKQFNDAGIEPDCIWLSSSNAFADDKLTNHPLFEVTSGLNAEFEIGKFDGVTIYYTHSYKAQGYVFIFSLMEAFTLKYEESDEYLDGFLDVSVKEVDVDAANVRANEIAAREGRPEEAEKIALKFRNGIMLTIGVYDAFHIADADFIKVGKIIQPPRNP